MAGEEQQRSQEYLDSVFKAEEDAKKRQKDLVKKFADIREIEAEEQRRQIRNDQLIELFSIFAEHISNGRITEDIIQSTFMSCDYDMDTTFCCLTQQIDMERQEEEGEKQSKIDHLLTMKEGLNHPEWTDADCRKLLEENDWDITRTIVSLFN